MKTTDFSKYDKKHVSYEPTTEFPSVSLADGGRIKTQEGDVKVGSSLPRCKQVEKKDSSKPLWIAAAAAGAAAAATAFLLGGERGKKK